MNTLCHGRPIKLVLGTLLVTLVGSLSTLSAQKSHEVTPEISAAIDRGLKYLATQQDGSGAWQCDVGYKLNEDYQVLTKRAPHVGVTSLAGMAFLAAGHLPGRGEYGAVIAKTIDYIVGHVNHQGFITDNRTRMYSHAFATLFLAEVYGMTHRADVKAKLQASVDLIVQCQNKAGSWRYEPFAKESDMSITVCQLMALRAARNIGIRVPSSCINVARDYVKRSQVKDESVMPYARSYYRLSKGSFKYQDEPQTRSSFALTAAGVASLTYSGEYLNQDIRLALDYMQRNIDSLSRNYIDHYFYYYGHYYAVQAMYLAGEPYWSRYWKYISEELLESQYSNGSWLNRVGPGDSFATAVASLILAIPYRYLPIFQR